MNNVKSLSEFKNNKKNKIYIEHISAILKVITLTEAALKKFEVYTPVTVILKTLREQKTILEAHLKGLKESL